MRCPYCQVDNDKVIDTRPSENGSVIRRRRECLACSRRFTTYENIEVTTRLMVVKKDGSRVPYERQRVLTGLEKACYKRPVSTESLVKLVEDVEEELFRKCDGEVPSLEIGRMVSDRLKRFDRVAYVRFASVYKQFRDLDDFIDEVRDVMASTDEPTPDQGRLF